VNANIESVDDVHSVLLQAQKYFASATTARDRKKLREPQHIKSLRAQGHPDQMYIVSPCWLKLHKIVDMVAGA